MSERQPLSVRRIVAAAVVLADRGGLRAVSMRSVGRELGVEAMSLYHHVENKGKLLDLLSEWIFAQIELPDARDAWRAGMVRRATSARRVLAQHPWALELLDSRSSPGPALLRHHDAVIGCLRSNGVPARLAAHTFAVIDSYVYGFVLTEQNLPFDAATGANDFAAEVELPSGEYPHLAELVGELTAGGDYSFAAEFEYGLDLILDGLARRLPGR